ncbi:MAG: TlyA family RNA methyltransferase [Christensenellales bacterium]|nr:TlyA family RNA methyltransferase [Christensenellales bacterium]
MSENLVRADVALVSRGLTTSRQRAQQFIEQQQVLLNGKILKKSAVRVSEADQLEVIGPDLPYVSRGGLKLEKALHVFDVSPRDRVCLDIGASTGGFTDVLLRNGAKVVYAVDVGTGQLSPSIAANPRVLSMENVNARHLTPDMFPSTPDLTVIDVSFISLRLILPAVFASMKDSGCVITLIKPQFEAGPSAIGKNGIITNPAVHTAVLEELISFPETLGWRFTHLDFSPIAGGSGNIEFLARLTPLSAPEQPNLNSREIQNLVAKAHRCLKTR